MYKRVNRLNRTDAAYIAGLIDGEGTVTLSRHHRNENRHLVISISNTEYPLLEYVIQITGVGKITGKKTYKPHHLPGFTYSVSNRQALDLLTQIVRFLKTYKAKRSNIILRDYVRLTPRNGYYSDEIRHSRSEFEKNVLDVKP